MNDYSEYLKKPGMMEWIESEWLSKPHHHDSYARAVNDTIKKFKLKSVIEIGCGTGEVAKRITRDIYYLGIDKNQDCQMLAFDKTSGKSFWVRDIREFELDIEEDWDGNPKREMFDIVCSFGVLKHFGLHEWKEIFKKVCSLGDYLIFNMPIAEKTFDDGTEYHHVWKSKTEILDDILDNGFVVGEIIKDNPIEPIFICKRIETKK